MSYHKSRLTNLIFKRQTTPPKAATKRIQRTTPSARSLCLLYIFFLFYRLGTDHRRSRRNTLFSVFQRATFAV